MSVLTRDQIKAYMDLVPNKGRWQYYRTAGVIDNLIRDMADSFALSGGQDFGVPTELEIFAGHGIGCAATITVTDTGATALQTAIDSASDGDVIEVATDATYDPITLPSDTGLVIRGALGHTPEISGQHGVTISDGARDTLIARFQFPGCSAANGNYNGAAVNMSHQALFDKIVMYQCSFPEVVNGDAIVLSHHQSISGDLYYTTPVYPDDFSTKFGAIECDFFHACKDGTEGAAIVARGLEWLYVRGCKINGNAVNSRGIMAQVCKNVWIEQNRCWNFGSGNSEAIKLDFIGSGSTVTCTGTIIENICYDCVEGIDVDDYVGVYVRGNLCYNCADEGISVDGDSTALITGNVVHNCADGIRAESGSVVDLRSNCSFANSSNDYRMDNGYSPDASNITDPINFGPAAALLPFFPTTPGNWTSSPDTVKGALDELAPQRGSEAFMDDGADVYIDLGDSSSVRRILIEYHMDDGTTQEHGRIGVGTDGTAASTEEIRQGVAGESLIDSVAFSADVSGGQVRLGIILSGAGASVTFRYIINPILSL